MKMERMWRKVNQGLSGRSSKAAAAIQSTDTASSAGFGDPQIVVAVAGTGTGTAASGAGIMPPNILLGTSTATGRRLATSGQPPGSDQPNSFSQHVITTASSERRRRRRRKSRPRRNGDRIFSGSRNDSSQAPAVVTEIQASSGATSTVQTGSTAAPMSTGDPTLRQRAVAKLRMFNFHLNWDLHMTQCKPCGPRSSGNILTRRLCRNRRREDNELYRSNSFKFERFERKEGSEVGVDTLQKQISVCDDYSLPIDFVKKRPSSFDPCLAETLPENWAVPSPLSEHVSFLDPPTIVTHPPQPVKLVEGYSDPKDSKKLTKTYRKNRKDKRTNYSSDSSAPKSSADEDNQSNKVPELNSPDSISEDLVRPLQPHKSPKKLTGPDTSKRNPSPYYYSDLLKSKEEPKEQKIKPRQLTASEPPPLSSAPATTTTSYKKSISLDVPDAERVIQIPKRYSITEDGVRIIRCNSPSTTTSDDSDCSECQKRRE